VSSSWPDTYSQAATKNAALGDVLFCVRFRVAVVPNDPAAKQANDFHIAIRGGQEGVGILYMGYEQRLVLKTKEAEPDFWQEHASKRLVLAEGDHFIELAIYGEGNNFYSEMKDITAGEVHALHASYAVPALGNATMIGWQLSKLVKRVAVSHPSCSVRRYANLLNHGCGSLRCWDRNRGAPRTAFPVGTPKRDGATKVNANIWVEHRTEVGPVAGSENHRLR
jgi:hypothetical protein